MISEFLDNRMCPSCNRPLSLYMRIGNNCLLRGDRRGFNEFPFKIDWLPDVSGPTHPTTMVLRNERWHLHPSPYAALNILSHNPISLFLLCDPAAINKGNYDYNIDTYHACYYRSTGNLTINQTSGSTEIEKFSTQDEVFSFSTPGETEKAYILHLDYANNKTLLYRYDITQEDRDKAEASEDEKEYEFHPNYILEQKELPIPEPRLDFAPSARQALLERLDTWIALS